jgi:hypothetical protein
MNPEAVMECLIDELHITLEKMSKAKKLEDKRQYSEIVKNLSESLGVFFNVATDDWLREGFDEDEYDEDYDEYDEDYEDDE